MDRQTNNGFGPLFDRRGEYATVTAVGILLLAVLFYVIVAVVAQDKQENKVDTHFFIYATGRLLLSFVIGKILQKGCLLGEESFHLKTRYSGSPWKLLKSTFAFEFGDYLLSFLSLCLLLLALVLEVDCTTFCGLKYFGLFCLNSVWVALLSSIVGCRKPSMVEISKINERGNKNVADGLAWSYYFGYLQLVLPELNERIRKSERYCGKISSEKLYILLPKNCYAFETIDKADRRVTIDGNLEPYKINRAGILERTYKHTVYSVMMPRSDRNRENEPYLLLVEYATPLMTLYDMSKSSEAGLSREQRDEQVLFLILLFSFVK